MSLEQPLPQPEMPPSDPRADATLAYLDSLPIAALEAYNTRAGAMVENLSRTLSARLRDVGSSREAATVLIQSRLYHALTGNAVLDIKVYRDRLVHLSPAERELLTESEVVMENFLREQGVPLSADPSADS